MLALNSLKKTAGRAALMAALLTGPVLMAPAQATDAPAAGQTLEQNLLWHPVKGDLPRRAMKALSNGQLDKARKLYVKAFKKPYAEKARGQLYANICALEVLRGSYEQARSLCDKALEINGADWTALNNRAVALHQAGQAAAAFADIETARDLNGTDQTVRRNHESITAAASETLAKD